MARNKSEKVTPEAAELIAYALVCEKHNYLSTTENGSEPRVTQLKMSGKAMRLLEKLTFSGLYVDHAEHIFKAYGRG